jgi:hypothetical protein
MHRLVPRLLAIALQLIPCSANVLVAALCHVDIPIRRNATATELLLLPPPG